MSRNEDGLKQRLIVTYSVKYQQLKSKIRENRIECTKYTKLNKIFNKL